MSSQKKAFSLYLLLQDGLLKGQKLRDRCLENKLRGEDEYKAKRHAFIDGHHLEDLCSSFFTRRERDPVLKFNSEREPLGEVKMQD